MNWWRRDGEDEDGVILYRWLFYSTTKMLKLSFNILLLASKMAEGFV